jgi:serine/threonine-protein kinase
VTTVDGSIPYDDEAQDETLSADEFSGMPTGMAWSVPEYEEPPTRHWPYAVFAGAVLALGTAVAAALIMHPSHTSAAPVAVTQTVVPPVTVTAPPNTVTSTAEAAPPPPPAPPPAPAPQPVLCDQYSLEQLRTQARHDSVAITERPSGAMWIPQLSSKRPGTFDDGKTYTCADIWREHNSLRADYAALLLWSGDWPQIFHSHDDYWVTTSRMVYRTKGEAQGWCDTNGLDPDHCFPTLIPAG